MFSRLDAKGLWCVGILANVQKSLLRPLRHRPRCDRERVPRMGRARCNGGPWGGPWQLAVLAVAHHSGCGPRFRLARAPRYQCAAIAEGVGEPRVAATGQVDQCRGVTGPIVLIEEVSFAAATGFAQIGIAMNALPCGRCTDRPIVSITGANAHGAIVAVRAFRVPMRWATVIR